MQIYSIPWELMEDVLEKFYTELADHADELAQIDKIQAAGHPRHCACRQVWGDGECECDLYELGYDPYAWTKNVKA